MVNISIDVTDLGGEARPGDKVVLWKPAAAGSATHAGRVVSTAPVDVFLTNGKATVPDVEPGSMRVLLQCRGVESQGPIDVTVPDGNGTVTLRSLIESQFEYVPPIVSAVQEAASNAAASERAAIQAQVRSERAADRAEDRVDEAINNGAELVRTEVKQDADRSASAMSGAITAKNAAQAAQVAAEGHADRADSSASNAKTSETNAKQSETNAGDFAAVATTAATEAVDAMESASDAASSIGDSVNAAAGHADRAEQHELGAAAYAQNASDAADRIGTAGQVRVWVEEATASAESASDSAILAGRSESNAKTSETNAKAHEQAAKDAATSGVSTSLASGDISRIFQADSPTNTRNVFEQDHYGTGYSVDIQNMPGANSAIVVHNYSDEEAVIIDNCDNENALEINNTINLNITPDNIAKGNFLSVAPWDDNYRKRWYLSLADDLTWRNDTAHPISFQRVNDVTPNLRPQDDIAFQVKDASGTVTARVFSSGAISTVGNIATTGSITASGIASKRHIIMKAASGSTEMTSTVSDDGLSYQNLPREIRVRKPVLLTLFWEGDGSIDLSMWNHNGKPLTTYGSLPANGQQHTMLRLAPPEGGNATLVPIKESGTVGTLHVYVEQTD